MIKPGDDVYIEYSVYLSDGSLSDSNVNDAPVVFRHSTEEILAALEEPLLGKNIGDEIKIVLSPDEAYGDPDPEAFEEVPLETVPENIRIVDAVIRFESTQEEARIHAINKNSLILDHNHPLAGETLTYIIRILDIETPDKEEE